MISALESVLESILDYFRQILFVYEMCAYLSYFGIISFPLELM